MTEAGADLRFSGGSNNSKGYHYHNACSTICDHSQNALTILFISALQWYYDFRF